MKIKDFTFADATRALPVRDECGNKGAFGTLLAVCGSAEFRGAAVLAVMAALRCGTGIVRLAAPERVISACAAQVCECTFLPLPEAAGFSHLPADAIDAILAAAGRSSAVLAGCGLGNCARTRSIIEAVAGAETRLPVLLDADALNSLEGDISPLVRLGERAVITPHVGEFSRLTGIPISDIKEKPAKIAAEFAKSASCVVVLKDFITHVASPGGEALRCGSPNSGLAKGGSGDVLAGIIASLLAQGLPPMLAAAAGCAIHSEAGARAAKRLSKRAMLPSDIISELPGIFLEAERQ
ncbi:MAG TPA: NAD(P)H-hydrate dehydratase [Bacillota bacterium]|nr:NAD(P)H-hydrate dehydratase [Bacillota bacterium]